MSSVYSREELIEQIKKQQEARVGGVRRTVRESSVSREELEFMPDSDLRRVLMDLKRELRETDNPSPRIFNIQAKRGS